MIVPWGTDAPIYHRPIVTIAMIVVNVLVFVMLPSDRYDEWVLVLGEGLHPLQWLTNNFLHAGVFHLVGNMFFLWTFGLVVEGKLGWWAFLLAYVGLGAGESAGVQLLVHPETPILLFGTSGIIFGLLAICLVWAPKNDVVCMIWFRLTPSVFDVSILWFVVGYIALDIVSSSFTGAVMAAVLNRSTTAAFAVVFDHTTSAILGFVVAVVLLKLGWVDCENWDLFAVLAGRKGQSKGAAQGRNRRCRWFRPNSAVKAEPSRNGNARKKPRGPRRSRTLGRRRAAPCVCTWSSAK